MDKQLEEIITKYKSNLSTIDRNNNIELEIRYSNIGRNDFSAIYDHLMSTTAPENITITQMISVISKSIKSSNQPKINKIRNIYYKNKRKEKEEYCSKQQIAIPYEDKGYKLTLSIEKNNIPPFISDETGSCLIRLKNRISFITQQDMLKWRIDMTIVIELLEIDSHQIPTHVNTMFILYDVTPQTIFSLFDNQKMTRSLYKYEIEAELINNSASASIKPINIQNMAKNIIFIAKPDYLENIILQSKIYEIASVLIQTNNIKRQEYQNKHGLRQLLPKVQALTRFDYSSIFPINGYYVTDKANGERAIGMQSEDGTGYIVSTVIKKYNSNENVKKATMVDAELVGDILYIFDIFIINGVNISNLPFESRILKLNDAASILRTLDMKVEIKPYVQITDSIEKSIKSIYNRERPYDIDGIILIRPGDSYLNTKTYKWKPIEDNTIDFLVKKVPMSLIGQKPFLVRKKYTIYFLFVGISYKMFQSLGLQLCPGYSEIFEDNKIKTGDKIRECNSYFPIQFSSSTAPLAYIYYHSDDSILTIDNNIIEFRCGSNCDANNGPIIEWIPVRIRDDRKKDLESNTYYGNDYKTAELTFMNYFDKFPLEQLWQNITDDYFATTKSGIYRAQTSVMSYVKTDRINQFKHANWIIDIGCGRGADLRRYFEASVKNLIGIDNDRASLSELIRRKYTIIQSSDRNTVYSSNIYAILADMTSPFQELLVKVYDTTNSNLKVDYIVCNLSFHYYTYTSELLMNFITFVSNLLKEDGLIVITCFIGQEIFNLLKDLTEGQLWNVYENQVLKYSIKKMYSGEKLEPTGQKIGVIHPFSKGQYYEEHLINFEYVKQRFIDNKFTLVSNLNISKYIPDFKTRNNNVASMLTADDIKYLSLYGELVFKKKK